MMTCDKLSAIKKYDMLEKGDSIVVGISGGADSVCLLHLLYSLKDEYDLEIKAVHVNHNIRGEEALRDENFVRDYCKALGVPLKVYSIDIPALSKSLKLGEEECGRKVRYECFQESTCKKIAVAHTASDNLETVLFNITRGSSLRGAGGIKAKRDNIIRPLIDFTRQDVEDYCKINNLAYVTDSTNLTDEYTRNSIRLNVIPVLKEINPGLENAVSRFSYIVNEEDEFLDKLAGDVFNKAKTDNKYNRGKILNADKVLIRRGITNLLREYYGRNYESRHIDLLMEHIYIKKRVQLKPDLFLEWDGDDFYFGDGKKEEIESWAKDAKLGINKTPVGSFSIYIIETENIPYSKRKFAIDVNKLNMQKLILRSKRPGDELHDPIRKNTKSIKKLFTEAKISSDKKNTIPILESDGELCYVYGFNTDSKYCIGRDAEYALMIEEIKDE